MNIGDLVQPIDDDTLVGVILASADISGYFVRWLNGYKEGYVSYEPPKWITLLSPRTERIE